MPGASPPVLRDYQAECVTAIRQAFTRWRSVLHVLPTGGGKTVEFAYITADAAAKGNREKRAAAQRGAA
jgi:superfamily II DNA or RNA helicase